ncbi:response regulator transcription factor [Puia sp. P3]|uniref:response regulator transcription factor n=1 Tax=Puia sp. P3 TaxID=3423952 RepID=UPI003D67E663
MQPEAGYQLAILDVAMPEMDGFELAHRIVGIDLELPFLFLTARNERADRLYGLRIGADDYISKPFDVDELVLRMRNIIRRSATSEAVRQAVVVRGDVRFNRDTLRLSIRDQADIVLTPREAEAAGLSFRPCQQDTQARRYPFSAVGEE